MVLDNKQINISIPELPFWVLRTLQFGLIIFLLPWLIVATAGLLYISSFLIFFIFSGFDYYSAVTNLQDFMSAL